MKTRRTSAVSPHEHDGADTVEQFAAKNAISRAQAYIEIASGQLTARKVGARTIITREDAAAWRRALPTISAKDAPNRRPRDGLPAWMSEKRHRKSRRKEQEDRPDSLE